MNTISDIGNHFNEHMLWVRYHKFYFYFWFNIHYFLTDQLTAQLNNIQINYIYRKMPHILNLNDVFLFYKHYQCYDAGKYEDIAEMKETKKVSKKFVHI